MHQCFIYAKLEELYLVNSKKVYIVQFNLKALKDAKYKIRKIRIRKAICTIIRKATVLKRRKFGIIFEEQFDTIFYCIIDSDGVEYSTSEYEYEYRKKLRVRVLILKNVLEYEYRKKVRVRVRVLLQV